MYFAMKLPRLSQISATGIPAYRVRTRTTIHVTSSAVHIGHIGCTYITHDILWESTQTMVAKMSNPKLHR